MTRSEKTGRKQKPQMFKPGQSGSNPPRRRQCMTASEYIRHSVVKSLQADGIDPTKARA